MSRIADKATRVVSMVCAGWLCVSPASAQIPTPWPYPSSYDSVKAAPRNHVLRYEDEHVRLLEVTIRPGETENMHGHPFASVFAYDYDEPAVKGTNAFLKNDDPLNNDHFKNAGGAAAARGQRFPTCRTLGPEAPHAFTNTDSYPDHFYRLEFKRLDGDDIRTHWQEWYPWMLEPLKKVTDLVPGPSLGAPLSKEWPYAPAWESVRAAPNNHYTRYEDEHIRLIEVVIRPGQTENFHGHQYPSVFAYDAPRPQKGGNAFLDAADLLNDDRPGNQVAGSPPKGMAYPTCATALPESPHAATNSDSYPYHFYRIEFKRLDGDGIRTRWKELYPWMTQQ